ncbi:MAG: Crp/Fnr family transcriptional regulator [Saprospiraceae bacterium]
MTNNKILTLFEKNGVEKKIKKNDSIYTPVDSQNEVYYIKSGAVKIGCYNDSGREITKFIFYKSELFGESAISGTKKRRDYSYAIENTTILQMDVNILKKAIQSDIELSWYFVNLLTARNIAYDERLESMVLKDSRTRIIDYLLEEIKKNGKQVGYEIVIKKLITHQEIANLTSTSRQTVTTVLNILKNHNIITFDRHRLLVRDLDKLKEGLC